jgi:hypothetical protein
MNGDVALSIHFSDHALTRFGERVRSSLSYEQIGAELERILAHARVRVTPPPWMAGSTSHVPPLYLEIGDDILFPLYDAGDRFIAVTCLVRGGISQFARQRRNSSRRARRSRRSAARRPLTGVR